MTSVLPTRSSHRGRQIVGALALVVCAFALIRVVEGPVDDFLLDRAEVIDPTDLVVRPETSSVHLGFGVGFEPTRLEQLPESIVRRVDSLLVEHVGPSYRARLHFVRGQVIDHAAPSARDLIGSARWKVFGYRLGFELPTPAPGVLGYIGFVTLDSSGHPIAPIEFPAVRVFPERERIVLLRVARDTAAAHEVHAVGAALYFSAEHGTLQYILHGRYRDEGMGGTQLYAVVDAHSGRFVRKHRTDWIE